MTVIVSWKPASRLRTYYASDFLYASGIVREDQRRYSTDRRTGIRSARRPKNRGLGTARSWSRGINDHHLMHRKGARPYQASAIACSLTCTASQSIHGYLPSCAHGLLGARRCLMPDADLATCRPARQLYTVARSAADTSTTQYDVHPWRKAEGMLCPSAPAASISVGEGSVRPPHDWHGALGWA